MPASIVTLKVALTLLPIFIGGCDNDGGSGPTTERREDRLKSFAVHVLATAQRNAVLVRKSMGQTERVVISNGDAIGEWVSVAPASFAAREITQIKSTVTRKEKGTTHVLISFSEHSIVESDVKGITKGVVESSGDPTLEFDLTENGTRKFVRLTFSNRGRHLAIIIGGEVFKLYEVEYVGTDHFAVPFPSNAARNRALELLD